MTDSVTKPVILVLCRYYLPGYKAGGPIQSIANIVDQLSDLFDFKIITSDRDVDDGSPYPVARKNEWQKIGNAQVLYLGPEQRSFLSIAQLLKRTSHNLIYLNSFFDFHFTTLALLAQRTGLAPKTPIVLAPRGEFSDGALGLKAGKKNKFLRVARWIGLHRGLCLHASNEHEADDIRRVMGELVEVRIASNLPKSIHPAAPDHSIRAHGDPLRVVFLSRISAKKNLEYAIELMMQVRAPVTFSIVGNVEDEAYWQSCLIRAQNLPEHIEFQYQGQVKPEEVLHTIAQHDLFLLPTRGENFGHVIFESLSAGTPVLISDQTPWRDLEKEGVGWSLALNDRNAFTSVIEMLAEEESSSSMARRQACHQYARRFCREGRLIVDNRALFESALYSV